MCFPRYSNAFPKKPVILVQLVPNKYVATFFPSHPLLYRMDESIELTVSSEDEAETIQLQTQHVCVLSIYSLFISYSVLFWVVFLIPTALYISSSLISGNFHGGVYPKGTSWDQVAKWRNQVFSMKICIAISISIFPHTCMILIRLTFRNPYALRELCNTMFQ